MTWGGPGDAGRVRLEASVRGRVQGVGYRVFALREAGALGLDGFVANEADGSVRVVAEGRRVDLEALVGRLEDGPPAGYVDRVDHALGTRPWHDPRLPDRERRTSGRLTARRRTPPGVRVGRGRGVHVVHGWIGRPSRTGALEQRTP